MRFKFKAGKTLKAIAAVGALVGGIGACSSLYVNNETEQTVVTRFGEPRRVILGVHQPGVESIDMIASPEERARVEGVVAQIQEKYPDVKVSIGSGMYAKNPITDSVRQFDDRWLEYDSRAREVNTGDKKRLVVDFYARWRISDPLRFLQTVTSESGAIKRIDDAIFSSVREEVARHPLHEMIRTSNRELSGHEADHLESIEVGREEIIDRIYHDTREKLEEIGVDLADVRIKRTELPEENRDSVFERMRQERGRIAQQYRSEGHAEKQKIESNADRDVRVIVSEAYRQAEEIKGAADADATRIYAEAYNRDPGFYRMFRTLESMKATLGPDADGETKILVPIDTDYFKYLRGPDGK